MISILLIDLAAVDGAVDAQSFELVRLDDRSGHSDFAENWVPGSRLADYKLVIKFWI